MASSAAALNTEGVWRLTQNSNSEIFELAAFLTPAVYAVHN